MRIVLRIGGSVVASPINPDLVRKYAVLLRSLKRQRHEVVVVVGGGALARELIKVAKDLDLAEEVQDEVAISVSRIFAQILLGKLGDISCGVVSLTLEDAAECLAKGKVAVMGGLKPGMTTDTVAALVAEKTGADMLIKASDQDGIYDRDPRKYADAVKIDHLSIEDLSHVLSESRHKAGVHQIIDPEAVRILRRFHVKVVVVSGFKPENILLVVRHKHVGTWVG